MFEAIEEPLFELEALLHTKPGLALVGEPAVVHQVQRVLSLLHGMGQVAKGQSDPVAFLTYLQRVRLMLIGLEKVVGDMSGSEHKITLLDKPSLHSMSDGLRATLSALKKVIEDLRVSSPVLDDGVGNREQMIADLNARAGQETTSIQFAFDGLEKVNQRHGREAGDQMLKEIAKSIRAACAGQGQLYQDGPGFTLVGDWQNEAEVLQISDHVNADLEKDPAKQVLKVVIGVVLNETEDVLEKTKTAVANSEGPPAFFTPQLAETQADADRDYALAMKILEEKNFYPAYQEIHFKKDRKSRRKFEALWRSDQLTPYKFFNVVKDENRVGEVTTHLLPAIFKEVGRKDLEIAINLTPEELAGRFHGMKFCEFVLHSARQYQVAPNSLIIELVEWSESDEIGEASLACLKTLKDAGCQLALDDYGVRSSNLVRLMQLCEYGLPPDYIKIDAALVKGLNRYLQDPDGDPRRRYNLIGIRSIVSLVEELRRETKTRIGIVAEFVDNQTLLKALEKLGVSHFQGFYLSKPKPASELF